MYYIKTMTTIYANNLNLSNCNVRLIFNNPDAKNTSAIKYQYTMPNSRNNDYSSISKNFSRSIKSYTRNLISSIMSGLSKDMGDMDDMNDMDD